MSEKPLPFVITDRRKFNSDGQPRDGAEPHDASSESPREPEVAAMPESTPAPKVVEMPAPSAEPAAARQDEGSPADVQEGDQPEGPTAEQMEQSLRAFNATAERLDLAIRAANPGAEHPPALTFESLVQSVYMQAVLQLGGGTQPGEQPQVDILGARQSIDMLGILAQKTEGNLNQAEETLLSSALFELRLAFLEMTQALARSAQQRNPVPPGTKPQGGPAPAPGRPGPSLIR
jgi:hypothetical protein